MDKRDNLAELFEIHHTIKSQVDDRITSFKKIWKDGSDEDLFIELAFCLLTPQAKAVEAWAAILNLIESEELFKGAADQISTKLNRVRFKNNKARHLIFARELFSKGTGFNTRKLLDDAGDIFGKRIWLVENVKGMGYKEASHFLRNIGFVEELAILDRHILRNMNSFGLINEIPNSITPLLYSDLENRLKVFSDEINIPLAHIDFVLWYKETGKIFK